ncbi:uncharacterized protein LOC131846557 [Achroia grisella]|uniref:uncharacterized protein LOC131846557 n=1 Tax=Achroia grisella TaxID=688607 RepID=UPI0027D25286|nr:uncharacterized protein LOC131846557 [Achroia grisella]
MTFISMLLIFNLTLVTATNETLIDTAVDIAHSIFYNNSVTAVIWCQVNCDDVTIFLSKYQGVTYRAPLDINNKIREIKISLDYKQVVLFISESNEFEIYLKLIYEIMVVSIQVILVLTSEDVNIREITNIAWKYDVTDVFILTNKQKKGKIFTYFPYTNGICGNTAPVSLNNVTDIKSALANKFENFQGCPIRITLVYINPYLTYDIINGSVTSISGTEADLPYILSDILNASLEFFPTSLSINTVYSIDTEYFLRLRHRTSDMIIPNTVLDIKRFQLAQISYVYNFKTYYWIGPPRRKIETWTKILNAFFINSVSLFFWAAFLIFVALIKFISNVHSLGYQNESNVFIKSYSMFLGQETKFKNTSALITSLFIMWVWFCVVMRLVFQADLTSGLQKVLLEPPLTSMETAVDVVDGYGGGLLYKRMLAGTKLEKNYQAIDMTGNYSCLQNIAKGKRFIAFADKLVVDLMNLRTDIQYVGRPMYATPACVYMRPGWPAAKKIDEVIQRAIEVGFVVKATKDKQRMNMIQLYFREDDINKATGQQPLSLNDFKGFMFILLTLMCLCIVVFIIELTYHIIQTKYMM